MTSTAQDVVNISPGLQRVAFTGGGSAGHVIPCLPIIDALLAAEVQVTYLGSKSGLESQLLGDRLAQLTYVGVAAGKLRRYFSWANLTDLGRILRGLWQAYRGLGGRAADRPQVLFSKGGFVSLPVVWAAWLRRIPVVAHESDQTPGLANRLALPFLHSLCTNFTNTKAPRLRGRLVLTGTPLRRQLLDGQAARGRAFLKVDQGTPLLLVVGGSLGAQALNLAVRQALPELTAQFAVVHLCGPGKLDPSAATQGYQQHEYLADPWGDVLAAADVVVSRAGANSLLELIALAKPHLLVPLPAAVSRGDQVANAQYAQQQGFSMVLQEAQLTPTALASTAQGLYEQRHHWQQALQQGLPGDALTKILAQISLAAGVPTA